MRLILGLFVSLLALSSISAHPHAVSGPSLAALAPRDLLRSVGQFTDAEWAAVERGESIAHLLDTDNREIAVVGAVRISGSRERLIERFRDLESLKRSSVVLEADRLSAPPTRSEMTLLPLEEHSLNLRDCRAGACPVRLGIEDVTRFHREVDWQGPDWRTRSASIWRDVLTSYVGAYVSGGLRAMPTYVNKPEPLSVGSEVALIVREYGFVARYAPELHAYLQEFGTRTPGGAEQFFYWTKEDFGVRPILRISHQVVYRVSNPRPVVFIATNQIYADHYLDAAVGLTLGIDGSEGADDKSFYMVSVNRARTRSLTGFLRRFVRATVQNRSREAMRKLLASTKLAVEGRRQ